MQTGTEFRPFSATCLSSWASLGFMKVSFVWLWLRWWSCRAVAQGGLTLDKTPKLYDHHSAITQFPQADQ